MKPVREDLGGAQGSENAGMSSVNPGENPGHAESPRFPTQRWSS